MSKIVYNSTVSYRAQLLLSLYWAEQGCWQWIFSCEAATLHSRVRLTHSLTVWQCFNSHRLKSTYRFLIGILYLKYISGISRVYFRYLSGISQVYLRYISGIYLVYHIMYMFETYKVNLGHSSGIFQVYVRYISGISQIYLRYISAIFQEYFKYIISIPYVCLE